MSNANAMPYLSVLEEIVRKIISPSAQEHDQQGSFPRAAIKALGMAGILGLLSSKEVGGMGLGLVDASAVVERIARECPSTAMIVTMHYSAAVLIEKYGPKDIRHAIGEGRHLTTLAWSEIGTRSHFWAPAGTAKRDGDDVLLSGNKSMVTAAQEADSYVWSSQPLAAEGTSTLWLVDTRLPGLQSPHPFDGLGLRSNASAPVRGENVRVSSSAILGTDGAGGDIMHNDTLPAFVVLSASACIGLMEGALQRAIAHVTSSRFSENNSTLADLPTIRAYLARARIRASQAHTLRDDTLTSIATGRGDAVQRLLEVKVSAAEAALEVTDIAMRVCGGAAFRKEAGIERMFRDARAFSIMAPTSDVLYDLIGRLLCDMAPA